MKGKFALLLEKLSGGIVFGILHILFLAFLLVSIFSTCVMWYDHELIYYISDKPILFAVGGVLLILILVGTHKYLARFLLNFKKEALFGITLVWLIAMLGFVLNTDINMVYDQKDIYNALVGLVNGDYRMWERGGYVYNYPFQNGIILLYAPLQLVFQENTYWASQFLNVFYFFLLAVAGYKLSRICFDKMVAVCSYTAILFFIPLWGYVKYFYGNLPGVSMAAWATYLMAAFGKNLRLRYAFGSAVFLFLALAYKNNMLIYAIAIIIVLTVQLIHSKNKRIIPAIIFVAMAVFCSMRGMAWLAHKITGCATDQGIPMIECIAMGLRECYVAPGWYNGNPFQRYVDNGCSRELSTAAAWESIHDSLELFRNEKMYAVRFFFRKAASIWNNPEFESFALVRKGDYGRLSNWMRDILYNGGIVNTVLLGVLNILHSIYLFGLVLYVKCKNRKRDLTENIPLIAFIGCFILHIFWEAKCQYTILFFTGLLPYAFAGYRYAVPAAAAWVQGKKQEKGYGRRVVIYAVGVLAAAAAGILLTRVLGLQGGEAELRWLYEQNQSNLSY